jgi:hypothetical protein
MALSCRAGRRQPRQLSGVKRTPKMETVAAANDPTRPRSVHRSSRDDYDFCGGLEQFRVTAIRPLKSFAFRSAWTRCTMGSPPPDEQTMMAIRSSLAWSGKSSLCIPSLPPLGGLSR